jgi:hypothetical protein
MKFVPSSFIMSDEEKFPRVKPEADLALYPKPPENETVKRKRRSGHQILESARSGAVLRAC